MCFSHFTLEDKLHPNCTLTVKGNLLHPQNPDSLPIGRKCKILSWIQWVLCLWKNMNYLCHFWVPNYPITDVSEEGWEKRTSQPQLYLVNGVLRQNTLLEPLQALRHDTELLSFLMKSFWICQEHFVCLGGDESGCEREAGKCTWIGYELSFPPFSKSLPGHCWVSVCRTQWVKAALTPTGPSLFPDR